MSTTLRRTRGEARPGARTLPPPPPRRRGPWRALLAVLLLAALVAGGLWVVRSSTLLGVDRVTVTGATSVPVAQVLDRVGVRVGTPLATVDTGAVAARVAGIRRVEAVEVHRRWPGTLAVVLTERVPLAVEQVRGRQGGWAVVDREGVALERADEPPAGLPVVGTEGERAAEARRTALAVLDGLPAPLLRQVRSAAATGPDDVTLELTGDRTAVWGSADRGERKAVVLGALLKVEAEVYDVSAPDAPTTRTDR
ncbi:cell division protein FtsQ/DivIB [Vallicoccus soli]|uniref:FtsQ-type POTRA domain-containing protein n=1 Tax=Vallicoccus soli TaxID=2339232 RepID=A0A3A3YYK7_9ACTN|nr:FtsQ-type POTRA domain-containing protein [Vallicoccus soli]RJK96820.1 FtsQ-type POTRA domain-containing protein [Vallicoccus soli]